MMLQHPRECVACLLKSLADFIGVLLNDTGEWNDVNDSIKLVFFGMMQSKSHAGKGLAAASWHRERVNPLLVICTCAALIRDFPADCINFLISGLKLLVFEPLNGNVPIYWPS